MDCIRQDNFLDVCAVMVFRGLAFLWQLGLNTSNSFWSNSAIKN